MTDTNVFQLSQPGAFADPLTEVLRTGARALLAQAVEAEVAGLLSVHADKLTEDGRQRLMRHGHLPEREIMTSIGPVAVRCPRVRDRVGEGPDCSSAKAAQACLDRRQHRDPDAPTALAATEHLLLSKRTRQVLETDAGTAWKPSKRPA